MGESIQLGTSPLHTPVMVKTCCDLLAPSFSASSLCTMIDCTLGMGGHTEAVLKRFAHVRVIGIDRDREALDLASQRLRIYGDRFIPVHCTYEEVDHVARTYSNGTVDAILMDLGVSSYQLDMRERGFSYSHDAPLDMRMDQEASLTAADILRTYTREDIARILRIYGEEKFAHRIAQAIVRQREKEPFVSTGQLARLVYDTVPAAARRTGGHPAKRTFQALRIAVNDELGILERALPRVIDAIRVGGRIVVESYHSLEDRLVKEAFSRGIHSRTPAGLPVELAGHEPYLSDITHGALQASPDEVHKNSRAKSVRIRCVERVRESSVSTPTSIYAHSRASKGEYR